MNDSAERRETPDQADPADQPSSPGGSKGRVLVVEDDRATLQFVTTALARGGFSVTGVSDALQALAVLDEDQWEVLLADIGLPDRSGFELVTDARRRRPQMAIALMTADASVDVAVRALRTEVDDFLTKPISPSTLVAQVERLVERQRTRERGVERVLAVGAHPDDVEIGVGAILLSHRATGDEISIATMSRGARGGEAVDRAAEAERAAHLLGARLYLEDLEDTRVPEGDPTVGLLEEVIKAARPTIVYTHTLSDLHQDHRNVHRATMVAARRVPNVYCYESPSATVDFRPARFVSVDDQVDGKIEVIGAYKSQVEIRQYLQEDLVRATARYWGRFGATRFSEPLEVIRDRQAGAPAPAPGNHDHG
ncbi:MAG TPA: response regulator [Acidimicrobiales bacterium]|nr:response regulator [Acidimicrobiales bacterium]